MNVSIHALLAECDGLDSRGVKLRRSFNPRTPCGVRLKAIAGDQAGVLFQSTHSLRSATAKVASGALSYEVSIHALLAECDPTEKAVRTSVNCFNPRTPCGVRPSIFSPRGVHSTFQSTHSLRSATMGPRNCRPDRRVSIHALLAECDLPRRPASSSPSPGFNPRTPCGVRQFNGLKKSPRHSFNPRTPCGVRPP